MTHQLSRGSRDFASLQVFHIYPNCMILFVKLMLTSLSLKYRRFYLQIVTVKIATIYFSYFKKTWKYFSKRATHHCATQPLRPIAATPIATNHHPSLESELVPQPQTTLRDPQPLPPYTKPPTSHTRSKDVQCSMTPERLNMHHKNREIWRWLWSGLRSCCTSLRRWWTQMEWHRRSL